MTHCALLSGKWKNIVMNDATDSAKVFCAAINGEFDGYAVCPARSEWLEYRDEDTAAALMYSFGNDRTTYLWGEELEAIKRPASLMISSPSMWERYKWYRKFIRAVGEYLKHCDGKEFAGKNFGRLQNQERLQSLYVLQGLQNLQGLQTDYRFVDIPDGATVYADPPYRGTANSSRYGAFDFDAFDEWLAGVDFPVYVSEFDAPRGCVEVARVERVGTMSANTTKKYTERLFVQERFADAVQVGEPRLFGGD